MISSAVAGSYLLSSSHLALKSDWYSTSDHITLWYKHKTTRCSV